MRLQNPYECPACGKLTCYGIACETCNLDDDDDTCNSLILCTCTMHDYIKAIFNTKDKLNIKETEIISLIRQINLLKQQIIDLETLLDIQNFDVQY